MSKCQRCDDHFESDSETVLWGGVVAVLCMDCRMEWQGTLKDSDAWKLADKNRGRKRYLKSIVKCKGHIVEQDWINFEESQTKALKLAYKLGIEFVKSIQDD